MIKVSIGGHILRSFSYGKCRTKDMAIQLALSKVFQLMGTDINPWDYIIER